MIHHPTNVLVVDDEEDFVEMLVMSLKEMDLKVLAAYSGKEGLELIENNPVDVVILDIKMPGMDGIDTLKEIKRRFPLTEVIMLTGHGTIESAVEGMKLGAFDYLLKPANFNDLMEKVESARKNRDAQAERIQRAEALALRMKSRKGGRSPLGG